MWPLVGLAVSLLPKLIDLIGGDKAGKVATDVAQAVTAATGATDAVSAKQKLTDPSTAADLQARLAQIAIDATKEQNAEADKIREDNITATSNAQSTMVALANAHSAIAWGSPFVSVIVTLGFFGILGMLIKLDLFTTPAAGPGAGGATVNSDVAQIINISVGTLGAAFATVVNFWLGSSQGSRTKDVAALQLQATQATQNQTAIKAQAAQTQTVIETLRTVATQANNPATLVTVNSDPDQNLKIDPGSEVAFGLCLETTLDQEGGYNPADPGGGSKFGITGLTLADWLGHGVTPADVQSLTKSVATEIYRANYWIPMNCGALPKGVNLAVFDYGVNAGIRTAVKALQACLGVTADGSVGPTTLDAVRNTMPQKLIAAISDHRVAYYEGIEPRPNPNLAGWTKRTQKVQQSAMIMAS